MELIYRKADVNDIEDLVELKIKQILFFYNRDGIVMKNENEKNGVIIHQMLPDIKAYITSVYTEEDYRQNGIQNILMKMVLDFLNEIVRSNPKENNKKLGGKNDFRK